MNSTRRKRWWTEFAPTGDRLILELALNGVPRKEIAKACGTAEVSIYKILEKQKAGL